MSNVIDIGIIDLSIKDNKVNMFDGSAWCGIQFDVSDWNLVKDSIDKLIADDKVTQMVTESDRFSMLEEQVSIMQTQINNLIESMHSHTKRLIALEPNNPFHGKFHEDEAQLKKLTQSVFEGLDKKWRFAAIDGSKGYPVVYELEPYAFESEKYYTNRDGLYQDLTHLTGYDTKNWQNSLIERDGVELTDSELCDRMEDSLHLFNKNNKITR